MAPPHQASGFNRLFHSTRTSVLREADGNPGCPLPALRAAVPRRPKGIGPVFRYLFGSPTRKFTCSPFAHTFAASHLFFLLPGLVPAASSAGALLFLNIFVVRYSGNRVAPKLASSHGIMTKDSLHFSQCRPVAFHFLPSFQNCHSLEIGLGDPSLLNMPRAPTALRGVTLVGKSIMAGPILINA